MSKSALRAIMARTFLNPILAHFCLELGFSSTIGTLGWGIRRSRRHARLSLSLGLKRWHANSFSLLKDFFEPIFYSGNLSFVKLLLVTMILRKSFILRLSITHSFRNSLNAIVLIILVIVFSIERPLSMNSWVLGVTREVLWVRRAREHLWVLMGRLHVLSNIS